MPNDPFSDLLRAHVHPLETVDPAGADSDLAPFEGMVGDASIVAIGEATHGAREFHLLRHRLVRYLVEHLDFRLVGLEAGWPECLALNRYIVDGEGDPALALTSTGYWIWDVWEFRGLVDWLRDFNHGRPRDQRVRVFGLDATSGRTATDIIWGLLDRVDPDHAGATKDLRQHMLGLTPWNPPDEDPHSIDVSSELEKLANQLRAGKDHFRPMVGDDGWRNALRAVVTLQQVDARRRTAGSVEHFSLRDRTMAANVMWQVEQIPPGTRAVLLAHNGHVTRDTRGMFDPSVVTMGSCLAEQCAEDFVSVGMMFGQGSFQAILDVEAGNPRLDEVTVGPPPEDSLDAVLMETSSGPALLLDTRGLPSDLVAWLEGPMISREAGAGFEGEPAMHSTIHPASRHELIAFVGRTSRANPTPTGMRPPW